MFTDERRYYIDGGIEEKKEKIEVHKMKLVITKIANKKYSIEALLLWTKFALSLMWGVICLFRIEHVFLV